MTLFKSLCDILVVAAKNDVIALTKVITIKALGEYSNKGKFDYGNIPTYFKTSSSNGYVFWVPPLKKKFLQHIVKFEDTGLISLFFNANVGRCYTLGPPVLGGCNIMRFYCFISSLRPPFLLLGCKNHIIVKTPCLYIRTGSFALLLTVVMSP
jgi:hypothetical protein